MLNRTGNGSKVRRDYRGNPYCNGVDYPFACEEAPLALLRAPEIRPMPQ
jgi:hypothetical protein